MPITTPTITPASTTSTTISPDDISAAITQLRRSERGTTALRHFRTGLQKHGMTGLDTYNWEALATLHHAARIYAASNILGALEKIRL